jgi:hypothetical protein
MAYRCGPKPLGFQIGVSPRESADGAGIKRGETSMLFDIPNGWRTGALPCYLTYFPQMLFDIRAVSAVMLFEFLCMLFEFQFLLNVSEVCVV